MRGIIKKKKSKELRNKGTLTGQNSRGEKKKKKLTGKAKKKGKKSFYSNLVYYRKKNSLRAFYSFLWFFFFFISEAQSKNVINYYLKVKVPKIYYVICGKYFISSI